MNPIEKNASAILIFAVEQNGNHIAGRRIANSLGIETNDVADALDFLQNRAAIHRYTREDGWITPVGKLWYHTIKGTMPIVVKNAKRIVKFLIEAGTDRADAPTIEKNTGLKESEIEDAVYYLEIRKAISVVRGVGKQPAGFGTFLLLGEGKNWYYTQEENKRTSKAREEKSAVTWDVFICHASEDKNEIAGPLAKALIAKGLNVWYDEFELKLGDSLRRKIDYGLVARERDGVKVILPVWHGVDRDHVIRYSPILADRFAVSTSLGTNKVVEEVLKAVGKVRTVRQISTTNEATRRIETMATSDVELRKLDLTLSSVKDRVSSGAAQSFSVVTKWENNPLVSDVRIVIIDPTGRLVHDASRGTSDYGIINYSWSVPKDAILGKYGIRITARKAGYRTSEASANFEVF